MEKKIKVKETSSKEEWDFWGYVKDREEESEEFFDEWFDEWLKEERRKVS